MAIALFIDETYLRSNTFINANVDVKVILPAVKVAQDIYIKDILGSKLYEGIQSRQIANTLTANDITLLELIAPALAYYTLASSIPFISTKIRNKGVIQSGGEYQANADYRSVKALEEASLNYAEYYMKRVTEYMCRYGNLYTEYTNPDTPMNPSHRSPYRSSFILNNGGCYFDCDPTKNPY